MTPIVIVPLRLILVANLALHITRRSAKVATAATCLDASKVEYKGYCSRIGPARFVFDSAQYLSDCVEI